MFIGGIQKFTMLDYPGKVAATIFTSGCNFRCPFCHNPEIVNPQLIDYENQIKEVEVLDFLKSRKGDLDGICITGGEPTLQAGLIRFIKDVKELGFLVKLDTNGSHADVVSSLLKENLVDYWAIDIKTSPRKYKIMTNRKNVVQNIGKSIKAIVKSKSNLELRTTVVPGYVTLDDFDKIIDWINEVDKEIFQKLYRYSVQNFNPQKTLHKGFEKVVPYEDEYLEKIADKIKKYCGKVVIS